MRTHGLRFDVNRTWRSCDDPRVLILTVAALLLALWQLTGHR